MDSNDVGRFGTLALLRRLPVESVVTSYPIDDEELTIGRDQSCSLRLYYPAVSALHAKITFVDRKAFLVVLGTNGILVDDSPLFPAASSAPGPTTVPLQNSSHLRPALINTPSRATPSATRRPLRLSMIASALVFTPGPSHDPQQNLRVLQSPLRTPFSQEQEEIVLVHSNTPRVVEEDKDLVILDEVEPEPAPVFPLPLPPAHQIPQTPVRRAPRPSLHRAVLIRSAQRAAIQREIQVEEEQDAEEVEETIAAIAEVEEDEAVQEVPPPEGQRQVTGWRKSLDMVKGSLGWAFRGLSVEPKEEEDEGFLENGDEEPLQFDGEEDEQMEGGGQDGYEDDADENYDDNAYDDDPEDDPEEETEPVRPLGRFMTPQLPRTMSAREARLSLGGGPDAGPRRVRVVAPWKVSEIQVPTAVKEEEAGSSQTSVGAPPSTPRSPTKREKLSEEEREAIRARRRSALTTPDNFFKGQTPGSRRTLFPSLAPLPSPSFTQADDTPSASSASSSQPSTVKEETPAATMAPVKEEDDEKEDTAVLLARMKQMVEGVKQRQSLGRQSLNLSPRKREGGFSLLAPGHATAHAPSRILIEEDEYNADDAPALGSTTTDAPAHAPPQTPQMSDLRHVFSRAHAEPSTPALAGVRDMFRPQPQGPPATPRMDGVREMLGTPAGYRPASPERHVRAPEPLVVAEPSGPDAAQDAEEEGKDEPVQPLPPRGARGRKPAGASRIARRAPVPAAQSAPAKSTRASSQTLEEQGPAEGSKEAARTVRRTRARTVDGEVEQPSRPTRGKAADKKPATPEPHDDEDEHAPVPATAARATRRTRQATESSTSSYTDDTADVKPARKTRAKTPTTTTKAAPTRRGTRAKPIEVPAEDNDTDHNDSNDDSPDALDSLPHDPVPAPRARRGTRSKIPVGAVKQEDVEPPLPTEP
ncbi:hypothetical protein C8Q78DRAFT_1137757, partial [Trametes maxima]